MKAKTNVNGMLPRDPLWYKHGVIYEVPVRGFHDSNADGTGDFPGLTAKLDYLQDLGVTALWLLPFYPSPLKDDGYDIADYFHVHPSYGTLNDFKTFLHQAHRRGLRVITELVLNHTSDQHPWFQRARRAKPGSRSRDYYVWSDTPDKYKGTRIIFKDVEVSNWTWDREAKAFFWHRFYSHQPDLNFDNPVVHEELIRVLDFWLDLGVDGVRLDAVPYLYEREGTSCENLPETHEFLKILRAHVDQKYGDRMLLAEANQWPDDAAAYFGTGKGTGCHMAFHFPLMPRLFMSLRMEDRLPIVDILDQTPPIPETAQWALFLRNHDELTLEMVTDEERDYMYRMYAHVYQARLNLGIRRRLAPLLGNDRRRIELLNALLFSLPGTPVLYYGDEIGMGENIFLGDRNGVRTPMQWSADRNAGFSRANPQSLYLPINLDPENHYEAVNVDVQQRNPHSLLWWMKRLINLRKRWRAFGLGTLEFLQPDNRKILAFVRRHEGEIILVVANLSRFVQPASIDLSAFRSLMPVELMGRTEFPPITEAPYFLTLAPHAFYWFSLEPVGSATSQAVDARRAIDSVPPISVGDDWEEIFQEAHQFELEQALGDWLPARRWFGGKARTIKAVHVQDLVPVPMNDFKGYVALLQVEYVQTEPDIYVVPLAASFGAVREAIVKDRPDLVIARLQSAAAKSEGVLHDAMGSKEFCRGLLDVFTDRRTIHGHAGELEPMTTSVFRKLTAQELDALAPIPAVVEQSNSSVIYGDRFILKFIRRIEEGLNPDLDVALFLAAQKFSATPPLAGALEYRRTGGEKMTLALLSTFVPGAKDAWEFTLDGLQRFYERVQTLPVEKRQPVLPPASILKLSGMELPVEVRELIGTYTETARLLGERTAALHLALASETDDPAFAPEPFTPHNQRGLFQSLRNLARETFQVLGQKLKSLPPDAQTLAERVLKLEPEILQKFRAIYERPINSVRIRNHGDYHLGQVLYTGKDFLLIDFEGEPARSVGERRLKGTPLRDVAGMIRSFHYAAHTALARQVESGALEAAQLPQMSAWATFWSRWVSAIFFQAYRHASGKAAFLPANDRELQILLEVFLLRKAVYEAGYELGNRPVWLKIPLQGILELVKEDSTS